MSLFCLNSYRILDLTDEKGTLCPRILADLGADVVRIEKPGGDPARGIGPFLNDEPHPERSLSFWYYNANKRSITLDIELEAGRELLIETARTADVVVESYPPGYMEKLGLGYNILAGVNSSLVMASITGFGQDGPWRDYKTCDLVASALGGQACVCGAEDDPPLKPFGDQTYHVASLYAVVGILLALGHRRASGRGQHVDVSTHECVASSLDHVLVRYFYEEVIAKRQGGVHWTGNFRIFPCSDGYILLSLFHHWETLVEWLDNEGMAADLKEARWQDSDVRRQGVAHITQVVERWTLSHSVSELTELGQLMRFPWAGVDSIKQVCGSQQLRERGFFSEVSHPELAAKYLYSGIPFHFSQLPQSIIRRAPLIGEHNLEVYQGELGLSDESLAGLRKRGVI